MPIEVYALDTVRGTALRREMTFRMTLANRRSQRRVDVTCVS
jgi:hypothetical protein